MDTEGNRDIQYPFRETLPVVVALLAGVPALTGLGFFLLEHASVAASVV